VMGRIPAPLGSGLGMLLNTMPPWSWGVLFKMLAPLLPGRFQVSNPRDKIQKLAGLLRYNQDLYFGLISHWKNPETLVRGATEPATLLTGAPSKKAFSDPRKRMMYLDTLIGLPDDMLAKVDRASMGVSLETRIPLLDHRVVEFAWRVPAEMMFRDGKGKWILRQVLDKYVPRALVERPKMGFEVPIGDWLRGPLRDWAETLLSPERIRSEGILHARPIQEKWRAHLKGSHNWQHLLWGVLMFQAWHEHFRSDTGIISS